MSGICKQSFGSALSASVYYLNVPCTRRLYCAARRVSCLDPRLGGLVQHAATTSCLHRRKMLGQTLLYSSITGPVVAASMSTEVATVSDAIVVYVTVPNQDTGEKIAGSLVESKLAACVNIVPGVTSIYFWEGKVNKDQELLLIIKTRRNLLPDLTAAVKGMHPYDEPEVVGLPILGGSESYLKWVRDSTRDA